MWATWRCASRVCGGRRRRRNGRSRRRSCGWARRARIPAASSPPTNIHGGANRGGQAHVTRPYPRKSQSGVAYREMRPGGGGGRVGVEDDDTAGLLDARVSRGEVDWLQRAVGGRGRGGRWLRGSGLATGRHGRREGDGEEISQVPWRAPREGSFCKNVPWLRAVRTIGRWPYLSVTKRPTPHGSIFHGWRNRTAFMARKPPPLLPDGAGAHGVSSSVSSDCEIPTPSSCCGQSWWKLETLVKVRVAHLLWSFFFSPDC